ncbi:MAG: hypothetical protein KKC68_06635 [Candidatus Thermoplasmatota archaeon]|nr:hypothetical protein [Candidatus Thermoplasmatota archaeon]
MDRETLVKHIQDKEFALEFLNSLKKTKVDYLFKSKDGKYLNLQANLVEIRKNVEQQLENAYRKLSHYDNTHPECKLTYVRKGCFFIEKELLDV